MTLPPLPLVDDHWMTNDHRYTADQMHAYARLALAQPGAEPVAWRMKFPGQVPMEWNSGKPCLRTIENCADEGIPLEYAYAAPTAQPAPLPVPVAFDADGFHAFVTRELPDETIIGKSKWWADHLTKRVQWFIKPSAAPQPAPPPVSQGLTPADRFEDAIREVGTVFACEWFGYASDSEFTQETIRVLSERAAMKGKP